MTLEEKVEYLINEHRKYAKPISSGFLISNEDTTLKSAIQAALVTVKVILDDLEESYDVAKELNPQCEGLINGSKVVWLHVKKQLENKLK